MRGAQPGEGRGGGGPGIGTPTRRNEEDHCPLFRVGTVPSLHLPEMGKKEGRALSGGRSMMATFNKREPNKTRERGGRLKCPVVWKDSLFPGLRVKKKTERLGLDEQVLTGLSWKCQR